MKFESEDHQKAHRSATINGGIRGLALGGAIAAPLHLLLNRRPGYQRIPITLKALGYVVLIVPCMSVSAEKAGEAYIRSTWTGVGRTELDNIHAREEARWEGLSTGQKVRDWATRNKYPVIAGAWAASMGLAFAIVARTPQTFSQKIVQARMWAQGLTVGTLIGSAILAGTTYDDKVIQPRIDHSWIDILEAEGDQLSQKDRQALRELAKKQRMGQGQ